MRACLYARKSTAEDGKHEQAKSCEQQLVVGREFCARRGWPVVQTFRDDGVSGAEFRLRPGFNALRAALDTTPRPFDVVVVMDFSRLGRDTTRSLAALLEIEEAGAQVWGYLDGDRVSLESESDEMKAVFKAMGASSERRKASDRTYAAMRLRFQAGAQLGGAPFGYTVHRNGGPYSELVIDPAEAETVRTVFRWFDEGAGVGGIARRLNELRVPAPRGGAKGWNGATVRLMLRRGVYVGERVWNRRQNLMRRGTRKRHTRPAVEWQQRHEPGLALIDRAVWDRVQRRIAERAVAFLRSQGGRLIGRPRGNDGEAAYTLSGLLSCARCGSSMTPVSPGRRAGRQTWFSCAGFHRRGRASCGNGLRISMPALDAAVIEATAQALAPETVAEAIRGAVALLTTGQADEAAARAALTTELTTIAARERKLLDALVDGDGAVAVSIKARLRDELARRDVLAVELARLDAPPVANVDAVTRDVTRRAADLRGLLRRHPVQARQALRVILNGGRFTMEPFDDARGKGYHVRATGSYAALGVKGLEAFTLREFRHAVFPSVDALAFSLECTVKAS